VGCPAFIDSSSQATGLLCEIKFATTTAQFFCLPPLAQNVAELQVVSQGLPFVRRFALPFSNIEMQNDLLRIMMF